MRCHESARPGGGGEADRLGLMLPLFLFRSASGRARYWRDGMKNFVCKVERFLKSEDGPTAVEYAVMLALIVVTCLSAITAIGSNAKSTFTKVAAQL